MKNIEELRDNLASVFEDLRAGAIKPGEAAELSNIAGKMINSAKAQIEYYSLRKEAPEIEFLKTKGDE